MSLSVRNTLPEEMDAENVDTATYQRCLSELDFINRLTFTHRPTLRWLALSRHPVQRGDYRVCDNW